MQPEITVYMLPDCPNCDEIKKKLRSAGLQFIFKDINDYDNYSELLLSQVTFTEMPVIKINNEFYDKVGAETRLYLNFN